MLLSIPQQVHSCKISTCNKLFSSFHQQLLKSHKSWQCITVDLKLSPKVHFVVSFTAFRLPSQKNGTDFPSLPFAVNYLSLSTAKVASRVRVVSFKPFYCTPPGSVLWRMSLLPFFIYLLMWAFTWSMKARTRLCPNDEIHKSTMKKRNFLNVEMMFMHNYF